MVCSLLEKSVGRGAKDVLTSMSTPLINYENCYTNKKQLTLSAVNQILNNYFNALPTKDNNNNTNSQ